MLDCGWDDRLDPDMLSPIKDYIPLLNAVLISHPDFIHLGALPYVYSKWDCNVPIFINKDAFVCFPVVTCSSNLAQFTLEDVMENRLTGEENCIFNKKDISKVYSCFRPVVYNQRERIMSETGSVVYINAFWSSSSRYS